MIVVLTNREDAMGLLLEAEKQDLMNGDYVFFLVQHFEVSGSVVSKPFTTNHEGRRAGVLSLYSELCLLSCFFYCTAFVVSRSLCGILFPSFMSHVCCFASLYR